MKPICRHFGICGGCSVQNLPYAEQLAAKEEALLERLPQKLRKPGESLASPLFVGIERIDEAPRSFRQKVAFVFGSGPGRSGLVMGHYHRKSHRIVPVEECPVHSARANRIAFALYDHLVRAGIRAAGLALSAGILRHLLIRTTQNDREAVAMLVVTRNDKSLRKPVRA